MKQITKRARLNSYNDVESSLTSAVFTITDNTLDRDGDIVNPLGLRTANYFRAGAPVFWGHQSDRHPFPIGSCINPETGELDFWADQNRAQARVHFDMADPLGRFLAGKVARGLCRSVSVAFVPKQAEPIHDGFKAHNRDGKSGGGWHFIEADLTEWSLVGVGSNPNALLDGAPPGVAKMIRKCFNCEKDWRGQADIEGPGIPGRSPNPPAPARLGDDSHNAAREEVVDRYETDSQPYLDELAEQHAVVEAQRRAEEKEYDDQTLGQHLAALFSHAKSELEFLDRLADRDDMGDGYRAYRRSVEQRMGQIRGMYEEAEPDADLDSVVEKMEQDADGDGMAMQPGEAGLVGQGQIPPEEEEPKGCCGQKGRKVSAEVQRKLNQVLGAVERWLKPRPVSAAVQRKLQETEAMFRRHGYKV